MKAEEALAVYNVLVGHGVEIWIDGGWGIDALLKEQTRPHKDLDALVRFDDLRTLTDVLAERGFTLKEIWSENRWVPCTGQIRLIGREKSAGSEVATAFVLKDGNGLELDFHVLRFDDAGNGIPAWDAAFTYPAEAFKGRGEILSTPVRCLSARMHMLTHTGYQLLDKDLQDLRHLHERFGVAYLEVHLPFFPEAGREHGVERRQGS